MIKYKKKKSVWSLYSIHLHFKKQSRNLFDIIKKTEEKHFGLHRDARVGGNCKKVHFSLPRDAGVGGNYKKVRFGLQKFLVNRWEMEKTFWRPTFEELE